MGQEILYCNTCGKRLVGDDFTRGRAHTFNNRQYCSACLPQNVSSGAQVAQPAPPVQAATGSRLKALKASSSRAIPAVAPARPSGPNPLVLVGVAFAVAVVAIIFVVSSSKPDPLPDPPVPKPPPAVVKKPDPPPPPPPAPAVPKEKIEQELKELDAKIQPNIKGEQFGVVVDLLEEARKRRQTPDWDQALAKRIKDVQGIPAALYPPLKEQASNAQIRGALAEAQQVRTRIALWGRQDLIDDFDKSIAAIIPHEALPAGAQALLRYPNDGSTRYRLCGHVKDGALVGTPAYGGMMAGLESGLEIIKVPAAGEVWLTYSTNSSKQVMVTFRALGKDGKDYPYNWVEGTPTPGRPQVLKFSIGNMKNWSNQLIVAGAPVNNIYIKQDDPAAVITVHELVIFKSKD